MSFKLARNFVIGAVVALITLPAFANGPIETEISVAEPFLSADQNVEVTFTVTNVSERSVRLLRWNLPFDGIDGDLFEVARNGEPMPYLGRVYKRGTPQATDYLALKPGESLATVVELSAFYTMRYAGEYLVRFRGVELGHAPHKAAGHEMVELGSNQVALWIDGDEPPVFSESPEQQWAKAKPGSGGSGGCSNQQLNKLASALAAAQDIAADADAYLSAGHNPSSQRYTEWFGAYSSGRWNTVASNFQAISDALDNAPVEFDCTCNQNYYAYVYPSQPYKIYLCRVFWRSSTNGTDSQAGTLVHEMSHFNVVAGTDDVTYGQSSCRALADSSPNQAIRNADSHEYFAENSPSLP